MRSTERTWEWPLKEGEVLLWQGRPAPRCYTFRRWKQSILGILIFLAGSFWLMLGYQLVSSEGYPFWVALIPLPLVLLSLWWGPLSLLFGRIRWEKVFYALTDQRILERNGLFAARIKDYPLDQLSVYRKKTYSETLFSVRLEFSTQSNLILHCLEHPDVLLEKLDQRVCRRKAEAAESV